MPRFAAATVLVAAALALIALAPTAATAGSGAEKCGKHIVNGGGWWRLKAEKTSCKSARKLADHFVFKAGGLDDGYRDWVCAKVQLGDEVWRVQCLRKKNEKQQKVTFLYGA
jgi:hypothetical protein